MARTLRLRRWQRDALDKLRATDRSDVLAVATPGAGKTTFALVAAADAIARRPGMRLVVVAPTQHLKTQWASAAERLGLDLEADWQPKQGLPPDQHGVVTTYQQVSTSARALRTLAAGAYVILDEIHHAGDEKAWGTSVVTAFAKAEFRLALSGTPFRSDSNAIPFVEYVWDEARADITYGYADALRDGGVVRPVYFPRVNGFMEWVAPSGDQISATFDDELTRDLANQRLRTALSVSGDWMPTVLAQAHDQLKSLRMQQPDAAGLVLTMDQAHAHEIAELLRRRHGAKVVVAVSDDPTASDRIAHFGRSSDEWIVAVRMVSEGVDIPRLRIGVFATTTGTELFFRQAVGRLVRWQHGISDQRAWMFVPDDPRLRTYAARLAEERRHSLRPPVAEDGDEFVPAHDDVDDPSSFEEASDEQLSLFDVITAITHGEVDVFAPDVDWAKHAHDVDADDDPDLEWALEVPPIRVPGSSLTGGSNGVDDVVSRRKLRIKLRQENLEAARQLAILTAKGHAAVNAELNRQANVGSLGEATVEQLRRRLDLANRWFTRL
jgi:superfamily II DNA or RNA helicase